MATRPAGRRSGDIAQDVRHSSELVLRSAVDMRLTIAGARSIQRALSDWQLFFDFSKSSSDTPPKSEVGGKNEICYGPMKSIDI